MSHLFLLLYGYILDRRELCSESCSFYFNTILINNTMKLVCPFLINQIK